MAETISSSNYETNINNNSRDYPNDLESNSDQKKLEKNTKKRFPSSWEITQKIRKNWPLIIIWSLAFIIRVLAAIFSKGYAHPDEHFQSIEIIYNKIFGYGFIPWEFEEGARSWFYPSIVFIIFKIMIAFGASDIETLIMGVRLFSGIISMISVITAYFFAKDMFDKLVGLFATGFVAFWYDFVFWATRTMTDGLAMNFVFLATYLTYSCCKSSKQKEEGRTNSEFQENFKQQKNSLKKELIKSSLVGLCIGLAFMTKFPTAIIGFPLALWFIFKKKWKSFICFCCFAILMVIAQGLIDLFSWGTFLHSAIVFLEYNIISGRSAGHGTLPFYAYLGFLADSFMAYSPFFLLLIILGINGDKKALPILGIALFFILVFSFIGHKEYRFIFPIVPLLVVVASRGMVKFPKFIKKLSIKKGIYTGLIMVTLGCSVVTGVLSKSFQPENPYCKAFKWIGKQPDVERLLIVDEMVFYSPGYSYLQRNIATQWTPYSHIGYFCFVFRGQICYITVPEDYYKQYPIIGEVFAEKSIFLIKEFVGNNDRSTILIFKNIP